MDLLRSDKYAINKKNKADGLDLLANNYDEQSLRECKAKAEAILAIEKI